MIITTPGLYKNLTLDEYHNSDGISNSGIRDIIYPNCPKNYWYKHLSGDYIKPESKSLLIGSAVHTLVLEPSEFDKRYCTYPLVDRRTKEGKAAFEKAMENAEGKQMLSTEQYEYCLLMAESLKNHSVYKQYIDLESGGVEHSIAWIDEDSGALLRSRPDYYNKNVIIDIKTSRDVSTAGFGRSFHLYGYHSQAAMAIDGLREATGRNYTKVILLVVSTEAPFLVKSYIVSEEAIVRGRQEYKSGAKTYQICLDMDVWPGYDEEPEELHVPSWVTNSHFEGELND